LSNRSELHGVPRLLCLRSEWSMLFNSVTFQPQIRTCFQIKYRFGCGRYDVVFLAKGLLSGLNVIMMVVWEPPIMPSAHLQLLSTTTAPPVIFPIARGASDERNVPLIPRSTSLTFLAAPSCGMCCVRLCDFSVSCCLITPNSGLNQQLVRGNRHSAHHLFWIDVLYSWVMPCLLLCA
jgi:hypothetical protein